MLVLLLATVGAMHCIGAWEMVRPTSGLGHKLQVGSEMSELIWSALEARFFGMEKRGKPGLLALFHCRFPSSLFWLCYLDAIDRDSGEIVDGRPLCHGRWCSGLRSYRPALILLIEV